MRAAVERYVDLVFPCAIFRRRRDQILDWGGAGCVPGRCSSLVFLLLLVVVDVYCSSIQSLCAMALLLVCGGMLTSSASSGAWCGYGVPRRLACLTITELPKDLFVFSLLSRDLCVVWLGLPSPLILCIHVGLCTCI